MQCFQGSLLHEVVLMTKAFCWCGTAALLLLLPQHRDTRTHLTAAHKGQPLQQAGRGKLQWINSRNDSTEQEECRVLTRVGSTGCSQTGIQAVQRGHSLPPAPCPRCRAVRRTPCAISIELTPSARSLASASIHPREGLCLGHSLTSIYREVKAMQPVACTNKINQAR